MRYAQLVMGPAGSGKSTYCNTIYEHCQTLERTVHCVNLDPAAEEFGYPVTADVRELVELSDVMDADDLKLGPNGGLVYCMEYLVKNLDWLEELLGDEEDDYFIFDCPGQIELYTHLPVMKTLVTKLESMRFRVCGVFLLDSNFLIDTTKYFSGILSAMSAMVQLEVPHVNVMSKMDLLSNAKVECLGRFLYPNAPSLVNELSKSLPKKYRKLNKAIANIIDDCDLVSFIPFNMREEESIQDLLITIDNAIQYGEDLEPKEPKDRDEEDDQEIYDPF